jgi:hypothetical protein
MRGPLLDHANSSRIVQRGLYHVLGILSQPDDKRGVAGRLHALTGDRAPDGEATMWRTVLYKSWPRGQSKCTVVHRSQASGRGESNAQASAARKMDTVARWAIFAPARDCGTIEASL